jgi:cell division protein FtsW
MAQRVKTDWWLFSVVVALLTMGIATLYSASSVLGQMREGTSLYYVTRQVIWAVAAIPVLMLLKRRDYRDWNTPSWAFPAIGVAIALLILVYFADPVSHRWLRYGPIGVQPSELAKPAMVLFLAFFLTQRAPSINSARYTLFPAAVAVGVVAGLVLIADLGTAFVLMVTAAVVFFVAGLEWRYIGIAAAALMVVVILAIAAKPYRVLRVVGYFDPELKIVKMLDPAGKLQRFMNESTASRDPGYQLKQSKIAVGSGGFTGRGYMQSKQKLFYLPEPHTDFIYAVWCEEWGLLGALSMAAAFLLIGWRGLRLALVTPDHFGRFVALGVTTMVVVQAFMNISVVLGMAPTKGIPLPLISHGGSSLLSSLSALGLLMSVSYHSG